MCQISVKSIYANNSYSGFCEVASKREVIIRLKNVFLTFCILQVGLPNVTGPGVTYPLLFLSMGLGALITC